MFKLLPNFITRFHFWRNNILIPYFVKYLPFGDVLQINHYYLNIVQKFILQRRLSDDRDSNVELSSSKLEVWQDSCEEGFCSLEEL